MNRESITAVAFVLAVAACGGETTAETVATTTTAAPTTTSTTLAPSTTAAPVASEAEPVGIGDPAFAFAGNPGCDVDLYDIEIRFDIPTKAGGATSIDAPNTSCRSRRRGRRSSRP